MCNTVTDRIFNRFVSPLTFFDPKESFALLQRVHKIAEIPVFKPLLVIFCLQKRLVLNESQTYSQ